MDIKFSDRMAPLNPSLIREMLKYTANSDIISFTAGGPSPQMYPVKEIAEIADELFKTEGPSLFAYGTTEGYTPLRNTVKARLKAKYNIGSENDDLVILSGGQQTMDLAVKCLCNDGDTIICEDPTFIGALNCFRSYRQNIVGVPMDSEGMDMDALEEALKREKNVRFIYTIPDFQNPMGVTLSLERRKKMYELACRYDVMILEDNPYFELRYEGEHVPLIKSLDTEGRVIFSGSASKIVAPGIRIGYVLADSVLVQKMVVAKQVTDVHTPLLTQAIVNAYMTKYDLDAHIAEACELYRAKRDCMLSAIDKLFPAEIKCTRPKGGLFVWFDLPKGHSGTGFSAMAAPRGVACVPGAAFDLKEDRSNTGVRLNFTVPSFEQIEKGIAILADCIKDTLNK